MGLSATYLTPVARTIISQRVTLGLKSRSDPWPSLSDDFARSLQTQSSCFNALYGNLVDCVLAQALHTIRWDWFHLPNLVPSNSLALPCLWSINNGLATT